MTARVELDERQRQLIEKMRDWAEQHKGVPPRAKDWKGVSGTDWPSFITVYRAFGSWDAGIEAAGWIPRGRGRPK